MADSTSPAQLRAAPDDLDDIKDLLAKFGFVSTAPNDLWTPALPRALRWAYNKVTISRRDKFLAIAGPANLLIQLEKSLERRAKVPPNMAL